MRRVVQFTGWLGGASLLMIAILMVSFRDETPLDPLLIHQGMVQNEVRIYVTSPELGWHRLVPSRGGTLRYHGYSRRGQWVYFTDVSSQASNAALYRAQILGNRVQRIGTVSDARGVVISTDGRWIAYLGYDMQTNLPAVLISDSNGGGRVSLSGLLPATVGLYSNILFITPDSQWLLVNLYDTQANRADIWRVRRDGTALENLTGSYPYSVDFSYGHPSRAQGIFVTSAGQVQWMPLNSGELWKLPLKDRAFIREVAEAGGQVAMVAEGEASFINSLDGTLLWQTNLQLNGLSLDKVWAITQEEAVVPAAAGGNTVVKRFQPARVVDGELWGRLPADDSLTGALGTTADGEWFIFTRMSQQTGQMELWRARDELTAELLTTGRAIKLVGWTPDREWILFGDSDTRGQSTLYRIRPDGTEQKAILQGQYSEFLSLGWIEWQARTWSLPLMLMVVGSLLFSTILLRRRG